MPQTIYFPWKSQRCLVNERQGWLQRQSGRFAEKKRRLSFPGIEIRFLRFQSVSWETSFVTSLRRSTMRADGRLKLSTIRDQTGSYKRSCQIKQGRYIRQWIKGMVALSLYIYRFNQFHVQIINLWYTSCKQYNTSRQINRVFIGLLSYSWLLKIRLWSGLTYLFCQPDTSVLQTFIVRCYHDAANIVSHCIQHTARLDP
jgi:hypothetical protein